ncbi:MAG: DoxX family protein [Bacteroidetes bacterium]|nr:DoxX family protein [Bacteroidota bacterium]
MSAKTKRIISIILMVIPSLMLLMSGVMKVISAQQVVDGLTKAGLGKLIVLIGVIELVSVALFLYPKTFKLGFLLLCCYLGGALCIELAAGQPPMAAIFLVLIWISVYLRDRNMFFSSDSTGKA